MMECSFAPAPSRLAAFMSTVLAGAQGASYPTPPRSNVVDDYHGTVVADPYRPLEDLDSAQTRKWIAEEQALTAKYLETLTSRSHFRDRLHAVVDYERRSIPVRYGDRYIYSSQHRA